MPTAPDSITENIDFAAQELLRAPAEQRPAMLEGIAQALTRRLLQANPGIGIREVRAVRAALDSCRSRPKDLIIIV
jgi:hypothetical protein